MKLIYASILVLAGTLAACHRDTEGPAYDLTGTYTAATAITPANPVRLFTAQGAVTDAAVVSRYLARRQGGFLSDYFSAVEAPTNYNYGLQLVFRSSTRATVVIAYPARTDTSRVEVTDQQATSFRLQGLDSVTVQSNPVASDAISQLTNAIYVVKAGRKCKPRYTTAPGYPGGTSTSEQCRVRPVTIVGAHGSQLYLPCLSWLLWSKGAIVGYRNQNNFFNSAALTYLTAGDTLVVQEREVALHR